jgi:hypothetical protein
MGMRTTLEAWGWLNPRREVSRSLIDPYTYFNTNTFPPFVQFTNPGQPQEAIPASFAGYVRAAYRSSGIVFALMLARASLFSEARFQWRQFRDGRPGPLFGNTDLVPLERPWTNARTGDLLVRLMQDYDLTGNFFGWRNGEQILRLRPDWVTIVLGSELEVDNVAAAIDARPIGYIYEPGGTAGSDDPILLDAEEVCHFTGPTPDPEARYRGISWLSSILSELQADNAMTAHRQKFFENGATPNLAVIVDVTDPDRFVKWREKIAAQFEGMDNAYKTLILGAGATVTSVGTDIRQLDFKVVQGAGESRMAAASGVPPVIVGFSEGLEAATYSNYGLAMRRFADLTMRPLWRMAAACFESILTVPSGAELWYDDRDIAALKDDIVNRAEVQAKQAAAAKLAFDAGYDPETIVDWLNSDDITRLEHMGVSSVQTQGALPAGSSNGDQPDEESEPTLAERAATILEVTR